MGVDFNRISFGISSGVSRTGFGSIVSYPSEPASIPDYGTILSTSYGADYIIGSSLSVGGTLQYPQLCDVNVVADGSGGSFVDYANAVNVANKQNGTFIVHETLAHNTNFVLEINGVFYPSLVSGSYNHYWDGTGSYYSEDDNPFSYVPDGVFYVDVDNQIEVPDMSGIYYTNGLKTNFFADGSGGLRTTAGGTAHALNTPYTSYEGNLREVPDFSGTYYNTGIESRYVANGSGGYTTQNTGSYYSAGTLITQTVDGETGMTIQIDEGYYYPQNIGNRYTWDGGGNYIYESTWYKPYGTFIATDSSNYNYYWDGSGGYYTV